MTDYFQKYFSTFKQTMIALPVSLRHSDFSRHHIELESDADIYYNWKL